MDVVADNMVLVEGAEDAQEYLSGPLPTPKRPPLRWCQYRPNHAIISAPHIRVYTSDSMLRSAGCVWNDPKGEKFADRLLQLSETHVAEQTR